MSVLPVLWEPCLLGACLLFLKEFLLSAMLFLVIPLKSVGSSLMMSSFPTMLILILASLAVLLWQKTTTMSFFFYKFNRPALKVVCALHQISHFCKFNHFYRLPLTIVLPAHLTTYFNNNHNPTTTTTVATSALATPTTTRATTAATNDGKP